MTPAARANDTTDIHVARGSVFTAQPARPFRTATIEQIQCGKVECQPQDRLLGANLGLYSVTFNNDLDHDYASLEAFAEFRYEASLNGFKYFLEVFNPNVDTGIDADLVPHYINDCIARCLAGVTKADRPEFLKIAYNGPKAMEELASYDPSVIVGVLGGGAGTTRDCYELIFQSEKYGARVALFGRKINLAEDPLSMVKHMRAVANGDLTPSEAVKSYHGELAKADLKPTRELVADLEVTETPLKAGLA